MLLPKERDNTLGPFAEHERQAAFAVLGLSLAVGGALRVWLAFNEDGLYWPDEIFQTLEPAHRAVYHYGFIAWEFVQGARNWAFPGLLAGFLKLCEAVGLSSPRGYLLAVRLLMGSVSLGSAYGSALLARRLGATRFSAAVAGACWALVAPAIYFSTRALSETASGLPVVFGLALAAPQEATRQERWLGAALLGLSVLLRLQNGVFCAGLLALYALRGARRSLLVATVVFGLFAVGYGLLDRLTWGDWFHSALLYVRFNLIEGKASIRGTADAAYYARTLFHSMPLPALALGLFPALAVRRAPGVAWTAWAFLALHSVIPHKELRFILPVLPVLAGLLGVGLDVAGRASALSRLSLGGLTLAACALSAARFHSLVFGDLGAYESDLPTQSAYGLAGPLNRLLLAAHDQPDLCGIVVNALSPAWTGGYTYLHRKVPFYGADRAPAFEARHYNYVISTPQTVPAEGVVAREGPYVLARVMDGPCVSDPSNSWRLP